jgi:hypothetical protein
MGHRPNRASWYAVTWQRLDRLKGYDDGAIETFRRGAYAAGVPLQPQRTREELYEKWRQPTKENASLRPAGGVEDAPIAPAGGVEGLDVAPSHGVIDPILTPPSTPSHGNHLEMPSTAVGSVSTDPSEGQQVPDRQARGQSPHAFDRSRAAIEWR